MKIICGGLMEKDGRFLLVNAKVGAPKGLWNIPAGKLDKNELVTDCAMREVKEETGYDVEIEGLVSTYQRVNSDLPEPDIIRITFKMQILGGELNLPEDEIEKAGWFSPEEIKAMPDSKIAFGTKEAVLDYLERGIIQQRIFAVRTEQI